MSFNLDNSFGIFPRAMQLHEQRAEILANNLANQDTPGFKARDLNFRDALSAIKTQVKSPKDLYRTERDHMENSMSFALDFIKYRQSSQPSLDGNTVDGQIEQAEYSENALRYLASLRFLSDRINGLKNAIRGGR